MKYNRPTALALLVSLCLSSQAIAQQETDSNAETEMPIARVTLYSSGVAWIDHVGEFEGGQGDVALRFRENQIADILKSLLVRGAGQVQVNLATRIPLARRLAQFDVDLSGNTSLPAILQQLRGEEVDTGTMTGRILDVTSEREVVTANGVSTQRMVHTLTLATEEGLRSMPLESIGALQLVDEDLQQELNQALMALAGARQEDARTVNVSVRDAGGPVAIGYLLEAPVWKTSYRLEIDQQENHFQAWAIVENTSDSDWQHIQLNLASGRPVSFQQDLYTPIFLQRPVLQSQLYSAVEVAQYSFSEAPVFAWGQGDAVVEEGISSLDDAMPMAAPHQSMSTGRASLSTMQDNSTVVSMAIGSQIGAGFHFAINQPVSLRRGETSMLPIFDGEMIMEPLSIFTAYSSNGEVPMRGARITNNTGNPIQPGPITVLDGGAYAGDAQVNFIPEDTECLISYAQDLDMRIQLEPEQEVFVTSVVVIDGVMKIERHRIQRLQYKIHNEDSSARTLLIEHIRTGGMELAEGQQEPVETTPEHYRFELEVEAGSQQSFVVEENITYAQHQAIYNLGYPSLLAYQSNEDMPEHVQQAFAEAIRLWDNVTTIKDQLGAIENERRMITQEQSRIRSNMNNLDRHSELYQRYVGLLGTQEDQMLVLLERYDDMQVQKEEAEQVLQNYMRNITLR